MKLTRDIDGKGTFFWFRWTIEIEGHPPIGLYESNFEQYLDNFPTPSTATAEQIDAAFSAIVGRKVEGAGKKLNISRDEYRHILRSAGLKIQW